MRQKNKGSLAVTLWGTGRPKREFLYVDDLAEALVYLMSRCDASTIGEFVNIGIGKDMTIMELAVLVKGIVGYQGDIQWDTSKPDGTPQKLLDVTRIEGLGWKARIGLKEGIQNTYNWYLGKMNSSR